MVTCTFVCMYLHNRDPLNSSQPNWQLSSVYNFLVATKNLHLRIFIYIVHVCVCVCVCVCVMCDV